MPNKRNYTLLHGAAYHFAHISRRVSDIAKALNLNENTIRRYKNDPEWNNALDAYGYAGRRTFAREPRRNAARDNIAYDNAKQVYVSLWERGIPKHKLASNTAIHCGLPTDTVRRWAKTEKWTMDIRQGDSGYNEIL